MACRYADGTEIHIGDTVQYERVEYEEGRGYGMFRATKTSKVQDIKVVMENGNEERISRLTKVASGPSAPAAAPAPAPAGPPRPPRRGGRQNTRKNRKNTRK